MSKNRKYAERAAAPEATPPPAPAPAAGQYRHLVPWAPADEFAALCDALAADGWEVVAFAPETRQQGGGTCRGYAGLFRRKGAANG